MPHIVSPLVDRELKKGSAELIVLSLLEHEAQHGYELGKLVGARSKGTLSLNAASLYPLLYRLEKRGWIEGKWVEKAGQRRRRYYKLTSAGRAILAQQRAGWRTFVTAINRIAGLSNA